MPSPNPVMIMYRPMKANFHDNAMAVNAHQSNQECLKVCADECSIEPPKFKAKLIRLKKWVLHVMEKQ